MLNCAKSSASILLALMLMLGAGFPAAARADFTASNLTLSIYDNVTTIGNTEVGINTGFSLDDLDLTQPIDYSKNIGLTMDWFDAGTEWSSLNVGMYGYDTSTGTNGDFYMTTRVEDNTLNTSYNPTFISGVVNTLNTYNANLDSATMASLDNNLTDLGYDDNQNNDNTTPGYYTGGNFTPAVGEGNLADFGDADTTNDVITLYLHGFNVTTTGMLWDPVITREKLSNGITDGIDWLAIVTLDKDGNLAIKNEAQADECPDDPDKTSPGICGCGVADTDTDQDGTADCNDECPDDPDKTAPGGCGCGIADTDTDQDGTADCNDECPDDPDKTAPGDCGCGYPEEVGCPSKDTDGDGMPDAWETENGLNPNDAGDRDGDLDQDDFTNYQEYASGTEPDDASSHPTRPTVTAEDQTVDANTNVTLQATATQGTNTLETFTWTQTGGASVINSPETTYPDTGATTSSMTFTAPAMGQNDPDLTLTFELTVTDSVGIKSDPPVSITITVQSTGENSPPGPPPTVNYPTDTDPNKTQVTSLPLELSVNNNNSQDADGDPIYIRFTVADYNTVDGDGNLTLPLHNAPIDAEMTGGDTGTTNVEYPVDDDLQEDTFYYWQAIACNMPEGEDPICGGPNMDGQGALYARFFVNAENAEPNLPVLTTPEDRGEVRTAAFAFTVDLQPYADDTDYYDKHTYELEIYSDEDLTQSVMPADATWNTFACQAGSTDSGGCKNNSEWEITPTGLTLTEDATYYWRIAYQDNVDVDQWYYTQPHSFKYNAISLAPYKPTDLSPDNGEVVDKLPVTLTFLSKGDPDNNYDELTYSVVLATDQEFTGIVQTISDQDLFEFESSVDDMSVSVTVSDLIEDQTYYWRVMVQDPQDPENQTTHSTNSETASFRINAENTPPGAPGNPTPANDEVWQALAPTFSVDQVTDPDGEEETKNVTYRFELFAEENFDDPIADSGTEPIVQPGDAGTRPQWILGNGDALDNNTQYFWRVTATDQNGASTQSELFRFTTSVTFYQATVPTLNNPFSGGTVGELKPTLSIYRSADDTDDAGDPVTFTYEIELYSDINLSRPVLLGEPEVGERLVSSQVLMALEEGRTYYWRARVNNGAHPSAWMPTASFTVDTSGDVPYDVQIELSKIARFDAAETQVFTLTQDAGGLTGLRVEIPPGALTQDGGDINLIIGRATRAPAIPVGMALVGEALFLAPEGLAFSDFINVRFPVVPPGDEAPEDIQVMTYDLVSQEWVPVASTVSGDGLTVNIAVEHFSLYAMVMDDPITTTSSTGSTSGGSDSGFGGCFIDSLGD